MNVDLITGFLGAGKTTFIHSYLHFLKQQGLKAAVIENEFGGADVDTVLLREENVSIRTLTGVCMCCKGKEMFINMLISAASEGYDRILVEPSGIYDVDEFFESMLDPRVSRVCSIGSILTIVDSSSRKALSDAADYIRFSQLLACGKAIFSKTQFSDPADLLHSADELNHMMKAHGSTRIFSEADILIKDWSKLESADYESLMHAGYQILEHKKAVLEHELLFQAFCFADFCRNEEHLEQTIHSLFSDTSHGTVLRIKGHIRDLTGQWYEINCTGDTYSLRKVCIKRGLFAVIGQDLDHAFIKAHFLTRQEARSLMLPLSENTSA